MRCNATTANTCVLEQNNGKKAKNFTNYNITIRLILFVGTKCECVWLSLLSSYTLF